MNKSIPEYYKTEGKLPQKVVTQIMRKQLKAYRKGDKKKRTEIINHLEAVLHRPRKSIIRSMNRLMGYKKRNEDMRRQMNKRVPVKLQKKRGRPYKYPREADAALAYIWESYGCICAERLYPEVKEAIRISMRDKEWDYSAQTTRLLEEMPLGTMKARLVKYAHDRGLMRGFSTTRSGELLNEIEIFHGDWDSKPLGYGQIDTVVHSGPKLMGVMAYTVNFVEMHTYWVALRAQLGKSAAATRDSIMQINKDLPFQLRGLHPDSGDEFINWDLIKWVEQTNKNRKPEHQIELTRSRPSKKNDNCNIEERNNEVVRKYIGYDRYDSEEAVAVLNEIYSSLELYINFFQPTFKLIKKYRKPNGQWVREYDEPRAPFRRLLERDDVSNELKAALLKQYDSLNPRHLLARIEALTIKLRKVQKAVGYNFVPTTRQPKSWLFGGKTEDPRWPKTSNDAA